MKNQSEKTAPMPVFLIDTREQLPWEFAGMPDWTGTPIPGDRVKRTCLSVGDYSLAGFEDRIALERKSFDDLFGTLTFGRKRFVAEIERAKDLDLFAIIVESDWEAIERGHHRINRFNGAAAARTLLSWQCRYPWIRWFLAGTRTRARLIALRLLERFAMVNA